MSMVRKLNNFNVFFDYLYNIEIVTNKYFRNYKCIRNAYSISLHKRIMSTM